MTRYRAYHLGEDDRYKAGFNLNCADDQEAIAVVKRLADRNDVELWQGGRKVARLQDRMMGFRAPPQLRNLNRLRQAGRHSQRLHAAWSRWDWSGKANRSVSDPQRAPRGRSSSLQKRSKTWWTPQRQLRRRQTESAGCSRVLRSFENSGAIN